MIGLTFVATDPQIDFAGRVDLFDIILLRQFSDDFQLWKLNGFPIRGRHHGALDQGIGYHDADRFALFLGNGVDRTH